jgi:hypothetical protein
MVASETADKNDTEHLEKAVQAILKGMAADDAEKAFKQDAKAIKELEKVGMDAKGFIMDLVAIDRDGAVEAIAAAEAAGADAKDLDKARDKLDKGDEKQQKGDLDKAVEYYGKAVKYAEKALEKAAKAPATSSMDPAVFDGDIPIAEGKYSVYDVTFVRSDTVGSDNPVFLRVSGFNAPGTPGDTGTGNEGFVFSDEFVATDTFLGQAGIMQLHVSCSDAFPGGIGAKSDPQPESQWLINTIQITKIKDGEVEKECGVIGRGLPEPEPEPEPIIYES